MAKQPSGPDKRHPPSGQSDLSRIYQAGNDEQPPQRLDAAILAEAHKAVSKSQAYNPFNARWGVPLSAAAVVVLSVVLVVFMVRETPWQAPSESQTAETAAVEPETKALHYRRDEPNTPVSPTLSQQKKKAPSDEKAAPKRESQPVMPSASAPTMELREHANKPPAARDESFTSNARTGQLMAKQAEVTIVADVVSVRVSGAPGNYEFEVGVRSPDTGCRQYADWWEVVSEDGRLLYRRVLLHSHSDEQPFVRSGGPVPIQPSTVVWVRAHMHPSGYGGSAFKGSAQHGFQRAVLPKSFAAELAQRSPRPSDCAG